MSGENKVASLSPRAGGLRAWVWGLGLGALGLWLESRCWMLGAGGTYFMTSVPSNCSAEFPLKIQFVVLVPLLFRPVCPCVVFFLISGEY